MESFIFVSVRIKGCFGNLNEVEQYSLEKILVKIWIQSAKTPHLLGLRQKWLIPSCCLWKVVTFFGKEHVNWSSINRVMKGRSWTIKSIIILIRFSILIFQLLDIITPLLLDQFTCSLPKNVIIFHGEQDEIIHFCLSPYKIGLFGTLQYWMSKLAAQL